MPRELDTKLLSKFLDQLGKMVKSRQEMVKWLEDFIEDVRTQEIAINSVKTGAAVVGTASAIALFTPLAPVALAGMVLAGGAGVATTIDDFINNKVIGGNLENKVENMIAEDSALEKLHQELNAQAELLAKVNK